MGIRKYRAEDGGLRPTGTRHKKPCSMASGPTWYDSSTDAALEALKVEGGWRYSCGGLEKELSPI